MTDFEEPTKLDIVRETATPVARAAAAVGLTLAAAHVTNPIAGVAVAAATMPFADYLLTALIAPQMSRNLNKWRDGVDADLRRLIESVEGFSAERLADNPAFVSAAIQATMIAAKTHQQEKLDKLRNALLNIAVGSNLSEDLESIFMRYIDELTPSHFDILFFASSPRSWVMSKGIDPKDEDPHFPSIKKMWGSALPPYEKNLPYYKTLMNDLDTRGLIDPVLIRGNVHTKVNGEWNQFLSDFGKQFVRFITSPSINT